MSDGSVAAGYLDEFRARGAGDRRCLHALRRLFPRLPDDRAGRDRRRRPGARRGGHRRSDHRRRGQRRRGALGRVCSGSGNCIPACNYGINPRFMVQLARGFARARRGGAARNPLAEHFQTMSRGVRVLSRLQMPPETLARFRRGSTAAAYERRPMSSSIPAATC